MNQPYPCQQCNMDEGSPVCLRDQRCPNQKPMNAEGFFAEAKRLNLRILGTPEEARAALDSKDAEIARLKSAIAKAYGYLWCVNCEPGTPRQYPPERAAYAARKELRDLLTKEQRGAAINAAVQEVHETVRTESIQGA